MWLFRKIKQFENKKIFILPGLKGVNISEYILEDREDELEKILLDDKKLTESESDFIIDLNYRSIDANGNERNGSCFTWKIFWMDLVADFVSYSQ